MYSGKGKYDMKHTIKERRVINIPREQFDIIKNYCDARTLDMPKWIVKNSIEKIPNVYSETDFFDLFGDAPSEKFTTYENVNPKFRLTKDFVCNILFPNVDKTAIQFEIEKKHKQHVIKVKAIDFIKSQKSICRVDVSGNNDTFIAIKNAYKDICVGIVQCLEYDPKTDTVWWSYTMLAKDGSFYA